LTMLPTFGERDQVTALLEEPLMAVVKVAVWPGPSATLGGDKVMVKGGGFGLSLMEEVAVVLESAWLTAVSVIVCRELKVDGAVYTPLTTLPTFGERDQVTAVLEEPPIAAVKVALWPGFRIAPAGNKLMVTGGGFAVSVMEGAAVLVESAWLVAVIVIVCCELTVDGAV
jgi:hypothetical protein